MMFKHIIISMDVAAMFLLVLDLIMRLREVYVKYLNLKNDFFVSDDGFEEMLSLTTLLLITLVVMNLRVDLVMFLDRSFVNSLDRTVKIDIAFMRLIVLAIATMSFLLSGRSNFGWLSIKKFVKSNNKLNN